MLLTISARGFDSPRLHSKDRTDQDGSQETNEDLNRSNSEVCDKSGMAHEGPTEFGPDPQSPNPSVHMSVNEESCQDPELITIIAAWPSLPEHIRKSIRILVESASERRHS